MFWKKILRNSPSIKIKLDKIDMTIIYTVLKIKTVLTQCKN